MSVEQEILIAVLKLTRKGAIDYFLVSKTAGTPTKTAEIFLKKLADSSFIKWRGRALEASFEQRLRIAVQALRLGADFERICKHLEWKEFESITTSAFEVYNYHVKKNFRFKEKDGKRWEIDLVACKEPVIASVDCKHWNHNWTRSSVIKTVEQQVQRTKAFAKILPSLSTKIEIGGWKRAVVTPIVLSLLPSPIKFHCKTPIVSVLQLQSFLNELPANINVLTHFFQELTKSEKRITEFFKNAT